MLHVEWYHICWPRLTAKRVEPVVSISWASCPHWESSSAAYKELISLSIWPTVTIRAVVSAHRSLFCPCLTGCNCLLYRICIHACIVGHEKMRSGADLRGGSPLVSFDHVIDPHFVTFSSSLYTTISNPNANANPNTNHNHNHIPNPNPHPNRNATVIRAFNR